MATATVVSATKDATSAYLEVTVAEGGSIGTIDYIGSTPLLDAAGAAKSLATLKAECIADITAKRNAQIAARAALAITGSVTV